MSWELRHGNVIPELALLPEKSIHTVCTSPPYWLLRDYDTTLQVWGGSKTCNHEWTITERANQTGGTTASEWPQASNQGSQDAKRVKTQGICNKCNAWLGELGSEPTVDQYIDNMVYVFRCVRRVLRDDGTLWLNIGDSYYGGGRGGTGGPNSLIKDQGRRQGFQSSMRDSERGIKKKSLCMVPARLALAMQDDGWYLRSAITWCKAAPMMESVTDRPTQATEMIYLFTKQPRYYYDAFAVRQLSSGMLVPFPGDAKYGQVADGANLRNFWVLAPEVFTGEHFAAFPSEIPRRAILAGTSAHGCCNVCGTPWKRILERGPNRNHGGNRKRADAPGAVSGPDSVFRTGITPTYRSTGWAPTCTHTDAPAVPCTVLDPFSGSGTTVLVADRLGRHGIGIELKEEYMMMAERRLSDDAPLTALVAQEDWFQPSLMVEGSGIHFE